MEITGYSLESQGCAQVGSKHGVSECWIFYAVLTSRVIFTTKTSLDLFTLRLEQVSTLQSWVMNL